MSYREKIEFVMELGLMVAITATLLLIGDIAKAYITGF